MIDKQFETRSITIENLGPNDILAHVTFQKSAISSSKKADKESKSSKRGIGVNAEASTAVGM